MDEHSEEIEEYHTKTGEKWVFKKGARNCESRTAERVPLPLSLGWFRLVPRSNRLGKPVKTRKKRGKNGGKTGENGRDMV